MRCIKLWQQLLYHLSTRRKIFQSALLKKKHADCDNGLFLQHTVDDELLQLLRFQFQDFFFRRHNKRPQKQAKSSQMLSVFLMFGSHFRYYERSLPGLSQLDCWRDRQRTPLQDGNPLGSCFSTTFVFRNVPGMVTECVRICGFKRNLSNLGRAPKMRDSVLLNSWESFIVTLPAISSETCAIYSSVNPRAAEFCNWFSLGYSCVSLAIAANFPLFLRVAIILEEGKIPTVVKTELFWFSN